MAGIIQASERKDSAMNRLLVGLLAILFAGAGLAPLRAEPDAPSDLKKFQAKPPLPPFPDGDPDKPLLPLAKKETSAPKKETPAPKKEPQTPEPPMLDKDLPVPPRVVDAAAFDVIAVAPQAGAPVSGGRVAVGFFNHGDRELVLEIDGRTVKLGSRYYLQLKLQREFSWRENQGAARTTKVPAEADGVEIVFRK
jgi:hypothetical protein